MNAIEKLNNSMTFIESKIGYSFADKHLLKLAFVHRSFSNEFRELFEGHNERLEFLGDTVLGILISEYLYNQYPDKPEGELSNFRSSLVEAQSCKRYIDRLDVEQFILMGKGERMSEGRGRDTILADLFEAIIGAIYLDGGLESARRFLFANFSVDIEEILSSPQGNWKACLQDYSQKKYKERPDYKIIDESGPDHKKSFEVAVILNGKEVGRGHGTSKKEAQQEAAKKAIETLEIG